MAMLYSLQHYSDITFSGYNYTLPDTVNAIIAILVKDLGVSLTEKQDDEEDQEIVVRRSHFVARRNNHNSHINHLNSSNGNINSNNNSNNTNKGAASRYRNKSDERGRTNEWKTVTPFKVTKIEKKEGVEKQANEIRVCLNKISNKNYEQQRDAIFEIIDVIETDSVSQQRIAQCIFDIAKSNKFYSELYATLYKELIGKFTVFSEYIVNLIREYYDDMDLIEEVDSDKDYDKYCENNKANDNRKACSTFIVNLMKQQVIDKEEVLELIVKLQEKIMGAVHTDGKVYQVDEMTENLFILITTVGLEKDAADYITTTIVKNIETCAKYKTKEQKSISSRAVFKYMDMLAVVK
jgi:hypothetical protein